MGDWLITVHAPSIAAACCIVMIRVELIANFNSVCQLKVINFYHQGHFEYKDISVMGPSGVRFSMPKIEKAVF